MVSSFAHLLPATLNSPQRLLESYRLMCTAKMLSELYEEHAKLTSKYVHATARGHEAIQLAVGMQLLPQDFAYPYYRDDAMLLGMGISPYDLMLQLFAKRNDPFSGGRTYYAHPSLKEADKPKIPHQSSATGMQAIPATGAAMGIKYKETSGLCSTDDLSPIVLCSMGDASVTEGEVAEAFQMAVLKSLPILYLVQDNEWDISAKAEEIRAQNAAQYARGFEGLSSVSIDGSDFFASFQAVERAIRQVRERSGPVLLHARVPLLGHHTSGVRKEWYRDDLEDAAHKDPFPKLRLQLLQLGIKESELLRMESEIQEELREDMELAMQEEDPRPEDLFKHDFAPSNIKEEAGDRTPASGSQTVMVDCALHAIEEMMERDAKVLLYGQDVGQRLGGVFREAATLGSKFGEERVFNTPIQEAFIIGSTVGMSAVGLKPIVEVQFADYIWPGLNQLFTEVSRSNYLSNGKWPVNMILRVPIGAYGGGGPYHSSSIESVLCNIKGIKIAYPSNGADLKGLMKAAYYDPNPVVFLEHKGLYWSKVPGTEAARCVEPSADYILPFGQARIALHAEEDKLNMGDSLTIITYGMGVHWALNAAKHFPGQIEVVDLRTLFPLDMDTILESVKKHGKCLVLTEEPVNNSFARSLSGRISEACFQDLDAPVFTMGAENLPAIPLNTVLEQTMLPSSKKVAHKIEELLNY